MFLKPYYIFKLKFRLKFNKNPLIKVDAGVFSQNEEDFIISEIIKLLPNCPSTFIEFGVGNGWENNTVNLIPKFTGFWVDFEKIKLPQVYTKFITYYEKYVNLENLGNILEDISNRLNGEKIGLISVDLDGNDFAIVQEILNKKSLRPFIFVVEYNSNFSDEYVMEYDPDHIWDGSARYGASYKSYLKLFQENGFFPVATNLTGVNAFFVDIKYKNLFKYAQEFSENLCNPKFKYYTKFRKPIDKEFIFNARLIKINF